MPTGLKFFNWIGTMWKGQITFETPMLDDAVKDSSGLPLSAVVVVSDGGVNSPKDLEASLRSLRARGVPVNLQSEWEVRIDSRMLNWFV